MPITRLDRINCFAFFFIIIIRHHYFLDVFFLGDCDFEKGVCTYAQEKKEDDFDWLRGSGQTPSWKTGPSKDHTLGTKSGMC